MRLEQYLAMGSYNQVLEARANIPHPTFEYFMSLLMETVRGCIAECTEVRASPPPSRTLCDIHSGPRRFLASNHAAFVYCPLHSLSGGLHITVRSCGQEDAHARLGSGPRTPHSGLL